MNVQIDYWYTLARGQILQIEGRKGRPLQVIELASLNREGSASISGDGGLRRKVRLSGDEQESLVAGLALQLL